MHLNAYSAVTYTKCYACHRRVRWRAAVGHHSLPWGYGDLWCSWKCCNSGKEFRADKRQRRKIRKNRRRINLFINKILNLPTKYEVEEIK